MCCDKVTVLTPEDTFCPRLKRKPTPVELTLLFTPTTEDLQHVCAPCKQGTPRLAHLTIWWSPGTSGACGSPDPFSGTLPHALVKAS